MTETRNLVSISGNTYPVKDKLKALGARWNPDVRVWQIEESKMEAAKEIVVNASAKKVMTSLDFVAMKARKNGEKPGICSSCGEKCKYPFTECWDCKEERDMGY